MADQLYLYPDMSFCLSLLVCLIGVSLMYIMVQIVSHKTTHIRITEFPQTSNRSACNLVLKNIYLVEAIKVKVIKSLRKKIFQRMAGKDRHHKHSVAYIYWVDVFRGRLHESRGGFGDYVYRGSEEQGCQYTVFSQYLLKSAWRQSNEISRGFFSR